LEDNEIIERYKSGQRDILNILVDRYKNPLYKLCRHLTSNSMDADDLFQETWVKVVKNIKSYDPDKIFPPWLYKICTNMYLDRYRAKKRWLGKVKEYFNNEEKEIEMESMESRLPLPEEELIEKYDHETIRRYINMMDDIYRLPIILYYFKEVDYSDIAAILDIPVGTVKSRLYSAKQRLGKLMEVERFERG
jgi:RNA polymerase sigma-70 factor (ECF subfamily)